MYEYRNTGDHTGIFIFYTRIPVYTHTVYIYIYILRNKNLVLLSTGNGENTEKTGFFTEEFLVRQHNRMRVALLLLFVVSQQLAAARVGTRETYFVDPASGDDSNAGTDRARPLRTLQRCASKISASAAAEATCVAAPGKYREAVLIKHDRAHPGKIRRFIGAVDDEGASTLFGTDVLGDLAWKRYHATTGSCVWSTPVPQGTPRITQLLYRGDMQVEARWPNVDVTRLADQILDRATWKTVGPGSAYGRIVNDDLAQFNFSWKGALATLNVAHQFYTWTRGVTAHVPGDSAITYPQNLPGLANAEHNSKYWDGSCKSKCNQYYLSGVLGALDAPGEFHHDVEGSTLYFFPPPLMDGGATSSLACAPPAAGTVEVKTRDYVMQVEATVANLHVSGFHVVGGTLQLKDCRHCQLNNIFMTYPTYSRRSAELDVPKSSVAATMINGSDISIHNFSLRYSNNNGLRIGAPGANNIDVDNVLVDRTDWMGSLTYAPLHASGNNISIRRATVTMFGNAGVVTSIPNTAPHASPDAPQEPPQPMAERFLEVAYSHIAYGGRVGMDTAALYTGGWASAGLHWHHNWIHDASEKCLRADDQSRNMTVHHNVIYNCGWSAGGSGDINVASSQAGIGIILKGDGHVTYANTVLDTNYTELCMPGCIEPVKSFRHQYPFVTQNRRTQIFNTAARRDFGFPCSCHNRSDLNYPGGSVKAIYGGTDLKLSDPAHLDFRPTANSPLVDAGAVVPPYTDGFVGARPDIGAYEFGGEFWRAGCTTMEGC